MNTFNLTLDLDKEQGLPQLVTLRQGDKSGTQLVATIYDHGQLVSGGYTARVSLRHPGSGDTYYRETATYSNGVATVTIDEQYAATVAGVTTGYFELLQGSTVKASTADFIVRILPSAEDGAVPGEVYDSAIEDALAELDAATGRISQMVVDATAEYLAAHPEITTTVQDNSVTDAKLIQSGGVLDRVGRLWWRLENLLTATPAESESVTVSDAAKTPVAGLTVFGKSTQDGTPTPDAPVAIESVTPNLLHSTAISRTVSGLTFTVNPDGSVSVEGTSTAGVTFDFLGYGLSDFTLPAGTYTLSGCPSGGSGSKWKLDIEDTAGTYVIDYGSGATFTVTSSRTFVRCRIVVYNGQTTNFTFKPALYAGSQAMPNVPYGHAGLWAHTRNLLRITAPSKTETGITFTVNEDKSVTVSGTATANTYFYPLGGDATNWLHLAAGSYRVSGIPSGASAAGHSLVMREVSAARWVTLTSDANISGGSYDNLAIRVMSGTTVNVTYRIQIEQGTTTHAYEPYKESVTAIPLDGHTLRSLPDGTRDEVTVDQYGHVTLVQRVGSVDLGTLDWVTTSNSGMFLARSGSSDRRPIASNAVVAAFLSDKLPAVSGDHIYYNADDGIAQVASNSTLWARAADATTLAAFTSAIEGATLLYPLATPVTYELGTIDPTALVGPDLTAQAVPTAPFALTYERDLNATLARLEAAIAELATN